jgi:hypothetical protein
MAKRYAVASCNGNNAAIHMVSAFASEAGIVLGQMKTP